MRDWDGNEPHWNSDLAQWGEELDTETTYNQEERMIRITQVSKYFVVDIGDNRIHMLNAKSLTYFLKKQVKMTGAHAKTVLKAFETTPVVEIEVVAS